MSSARALSDVLPEPLVLSRPSGEIVHLNPAAERFFGWSDHEIHGFPRATLLSPGSSISQSAEAFAPTSARRRDGTAIACAIAEGRVDVDGESLVVWTVRGAGEADAQNQLRILAMALRHSATGTELTDPEGRILWVNHAFTELTGWPREEIIGQTPRILRPPDADEAPYDEIMRFIHDGHVWRGELVRRRKDGTLYDANVTVSPIFDRDGELTHLIAHHDDVTERKRALAELARTAAKLRLSLERVGHVLEDEGMEPEAKIALLREMLLTREG